MQKILHMYRAEGLYNQEFAPFLNGYIGEHVEFYQPGARQLAGVSHPVPRSISRPLPNPMQHQHLGRYRPYSLPKEIPKLRYVEIDDFDNPSCTPPSAFDKASFTTRIGEQSKAVTSVRKCGDPRRSPVAGPSHLGAISVSSSDSAASPGPLSGFKMSQSSTSADDSASLQLRRLQTGQGLTFEQWMSVCVRCPKCDNFYLQGKVFEKHVKKCLGMFDI